MRLPNTGRTRRIGLVAAALAVVIPVGAVAANAGTQVSASDSLEGQGSWTFERTGSGSGSFNSDSFWARTGSGYVLLGARTGWSALARTVTVPVGIRTCQAGIWIDPVALGATKKVHVNVEVIDPSSWTYMALTSKDLSPSGYTRLSTPTFSTSPRTFVFRVALVSNGAELQLIDLDDFGLTCST